MEHRDEQTSAVGLRPRPTLATRIILAGAIGVALWAPAMVDAQTPKPGAGDATLTFEVASVKANKSGEAFVRFQTQPGGRFTATNVPVRELIRAAYGVQPFQIDGAPSWIGSERFDILAKAEAEFPPGPLGGPPGALAFMLRNLLADRFQLSVRNETREMPVYALVSARPDGPNTKLHPPAADCAALMAGARGRGGPPPPPPGPGSPMTCGMRMMPGRLSAGSTPLAQFANALAPMVGRTVIDKTGISGLFDFDLQWTPDQMPLGAPPPGAPPLPPIDPNGPSIFTALQEQLGLKLDSQRGPVEVLVIDRVERPTED